MAPPGAREEAERAPDDVYAVYAELLRRRRETLVGGEVPAGNPSHADHVAAVAAWDRVARRHLESLRTGPGRTTPWDDLPLGEEAGPSSNTTAVANRLHAIALCLATPASRLYGGAEATARVAEGLRVLHTSVYHAGRAQYGNWWDWEIGTPGAVGDTCVLLGDAVGADTRAGLLAAIDHFVPDPRRMLRDSLVSTGANRVDLCRITAVRGALSADPDRLALASSSLVGVLDPVPIGDGFHADGSFLMHTCVAYPGTYGEVLLRGMVELTRLLAGTEWDVGAAERARTTRVVEQTFVPLVHGGLMLDSVRGRAISRSHARDADDGFLLAVDAVGLAAALPPEEAATALRLRSLAKRWLRRNTHRPLAERPPARIAAVAGVLADPDVPEADEPVGHFAFPDMERIVHRRPGWTYSLSLNSDRVARHEYMNGENARGWHTGDGMFQLHLDDDLFQYTDEYWPTVDPKRLPGITVDTAPLPAGAGGDNDHVPLSGTRWSGAVGPVAGSGLGLAGMDFRGIDSPLRARRSWLFLDDAVLTASCGVTADGGRRIETVVDARNLHAPDDPRPARLTVDGTEAPEALGETLRHPRPRWAHLGGTGGYVFLGLPEGVPGPHELLSRREDRTGSWRDLNVGGPTAPVTRRHLTLWHDHGTDPTGAAHAHLLLPGASSTATAARAARPGVEVVALDEGVHAFRTAPGAPGVPPGARLTAVNFFAAGSAAGITADGPCAVLVLREPRALRIAVSDPSRSAAVVRLTLDREQAGGRRVVRESDTGLTVLSAGEDGVHLLAETGGRHGATLAATLIPGPGHAAPHRRAVLLEPVADATVRGGAHSGENDGASAVLTVHNGGDGDERRAYLRFRLPRGTGAGDVRRAVLWVRGHVPNDPGTREDDMLHTSLRARGPAGKDWSETDLTWDTAPAPGPALGEGRVTTYDDWTGLDVTAAARRPITGEWTLVLAQDGRGHRVRLNSGEAGEDGPLLQLVTGR
ncbi:polysaccharide lyase family 8 super-sandwich domain-containing protein [Streptomyces megasporus]|uniref:polysaccharide lyase family 8 super-sandwich domain-containing protein n=1 Tax=Streptomyces megasporus TaxID=44060 RepID=UPI00146FDDE1|nr:polysaccharide lyase family 8 super-sandwich domain-containing protein [Streptomyces megasporus]